MVTYYLRTFEMLIYLEARKDKQKIYQGNDRDESNYCEEAVAYAAAVKAYADD